MGHSNCGEFRLRPMLGIEVMVLTFHSKFSRSRGLGIFIEFIALLGST